MSDDGPDNAAGDDANRKEEDLFPQTAEIVEALLESTPQLALQVWRGHAGELTEWVFVGSVSVSAFCITRAAARFVFNRREIRETFLALQGRVAEFVTLPTSAPQPGEPWEGESLIPHVKQREGSF